jgi:hypothetical protein
MQLSPIGCQDREALGETTAECPVINRHDCICITVCLGGGRSWHSTSKWLVSREAMWIFCSGVELGAGFDVAEMALRNTQRSEKMPIIFPRKYYNIIIFF